MSPSTRERDNARRRADEWSARQALAREATLSRRRTALAVVAGVIAAALITVGAIAVINGPSGQQDASANQPTATGSAAPPSPSPSTSSRPAPDPSVAENRTWTGTIATSQGDLGVELYGERAPAAVASFVTLAKENFFQDTPCHRLVTSGIFVLQCGDPTGTGTGGPGYSYGPIENAPADDVYPAGTLAMARPGNTTDGQGSQFFVVYQDSTIPSDPAGGYTVFGRVTSGLDVVQKVADAGVAGGASDGSPAQAITLGAVTLQ